MKCIVPSLIGLPKSDRELAAFIQSIPHQPELDEFGGLKIQHYPDSGLSIYFDERDRVRTVFLFSGRTSDGRRYLGPLPEEVTFEFGRGDLIAKFGHPQKSGPNWDTFIRDGRVFHFQYADGGASVGQITIFAWDQKEELNRVAGSD